jgi:Ras family
MWSVSYRSLSLFCPLSPPYDRQDLAVKRVYQRLLHPSIVRVDSRHAAHASFTPDPLSPANPPCLRTTSTTYMSTTSQLSSVSGTQPVRLLPRLCLPLLPQGAVDTLSLAGQEEFDRLRSLSYAETHVVMICFSVRPSVTFAPYH